LDLDGDDVVISNNVDIDNINRNVNNSNLSSERVNVDTWSMHDEADNEYTEYEEDDDYIPYDEEIFEFVNETKDEWMDSLEGYLCFGESLDVGSELENEWKISSDENILLLKVVQNHIVVMRKTKMRVKMLWIRRRRRRLIPHLILNARYLKWKLMN